MDLGLDSPQKQNLRFSFTSSIGSAQGWDNLKGPLPEEVPLDPSVAVGSGYGEGKYATERVSREEQTSRTNGIDHAWIDYSQERVTRDRPSHWSNDRWIRWIVGHDGLVPDHRQV